MTEPQPREQELGDEPHDAQPEHVVPYRGSLAAPYQGQQEVPHRESSVAPYQGQQLVAPKSPILHGLASFFIAGLGTMLAGRPVRGLLILGMAVINWLLFFIPFIGLFFIITGFGITVFSVIHGYLSAVKWNARHGVIS